MTTGSRHLCRICKVNPYNRCFACGWQTIVAFPCEVVFEDGELREGMGERTEPQRTVMVKAGDIERMYFQKQPERWLCFYRAS